MARTNKIKNTSSENNKTSKAVKTAENSNAKRNDLVQPEEVLKDIEDTIKENNKKFDKITEKISEFNGSVDIENEETQKEIINNIAEADNAIKELEEEIKKQENTLNKTQKATVNQNFTAFWNGISTDW